VRLDFCAAISIFRAMFGREEGMSRNFITVLVRRTPSGRL
jgi:hypothetical protein